MIGCEDRLRNDLLCVGWGVKLYSLTHSRSRWNNICWNHHCTGGSIQYSTLRRSAIAISRIFICLPLKAWMHRCWLCECTADDAAFNRAISPAGQLKQPLLYLPPPPQHPPPSSGAQPQRHLSTDDTCEDEDIYSRIPASSSEGGDNYPPSLPLVDYYSGHSAGYDAVDSGSYNDGLEDSLPPRRAPRATMSKLVSASPQLQRRLCDQVIQQFVTYWSLEAVNKEIFN